VTHLDSSPLFYNYIIIKITIYLIKLLFCISIMDIQANIQKRKRADTAPNEYIFEYLIDGEPAIIVDTLRYGLPSNIEDNSDNSDINQPDNKLLEKSILFQSI
jgi:hypothetical protein